MTQEKPTNEGIEEDWGLPKAQDEGVWGEPKVNPEDFTEAEHAAVDKMAAPILADNKRRKKFLSRNRNNWKRMNTPVKISKREKGSEFIFSILARAGI